MKNFLFRTAELILATALYQWTCTATAQMHIEQVQRDFQVRYHLLNPGAYITWPKCSGSESPAPHFPKDGFYGDITLDPDRGVELVQDLSQKFYSIAIIYNQFVRARNGVSGLEGSPSIDYYSANDMPNPGPVTTGNYLSILETISAQLSTLTLLKVQADQVIAADYSDCKLTSVSLTGLHDCPTSQNCTTSEHSNVTRWGHLVDTDDLVCGQFTYDYPYSLAYPCSAPLSRITRVFEDARGYYQSIGSFAAGQSARNIRGRIRADLTKYTNGTAAIFLKLTTVSCQEAFWSCHAAIDGDNWPCTAVFAQSGPIAASDPVNTYGHWAAGVLKLGSVSTSDYVTYSDATPGAFGNCNLNNASILYGWSIADAVIVVTPDFTVVPDPEDCCSCSTCEAGTTSFALKSIHADMTLGNDNFGASAGALILEADVPNPNLATPAALRFTYASTVEAITDGLNPVQHMQFKTSQALADIQVNTAYKYTISIYTAADAGSKNGLFYQPTGTPYRIIVVENPDASPTLYNHLRFTTTADSKTVVTEYIYDPSTSQWEMDTGNGLRKEFRISTWDQAQVNRTEAVFVKNSANQLTYGETNTWHIFPWGQEIVQKVIDLNGASLTSTWSFYSDPINDGGNYRQLKQEINPYGHWINYQYDQYGRETKRVEQFLNSGVYSADNLNRVTTTTYSTTDPQITTVEMLQGLEVSRRYTLIRSGEVDDIQCQTPGAAYTASDNLVTVTKKYTSGSFAGQLQRIQNPDGTVQIYNYSATSSQKTTVLLSGVPNPSDQSSILEGTITTTVTTLGGQVLSRVVTRRTLGVTPDIVIDQDIYTYLDARHRSYTVAHYDGTTTQHNYGCCGIANETDHDGIVTSYGYDDLGRQTTVTRNGITTASVLDPNGAVTATIRTGTDNSPITIHQQSFDMAGHLISDINGLAGLRARA